MALGQVRARMSGDVYQGLFFWRHAAALLIPDSHVSKVCFEHESVASMDDIVVFYDYPGINAGGWSCMVDYYQVKYHLDRQHAYSEEALIDPDFTRTAKSLLRKFYDAFVKISAQQQAFRLHFASNWDWDGDDTLAAALREDGGELPDTFYTASLSHPLGRIRESWRNHLGLSTEEFFAFARTLRLELSYFGRRDFECLVSSTLTGAGLCCPSAEQQASPYDSLYQQFVLDGRNCFDASSLRDVCEREGLVRETGSRPRRLPTVGIRSYVPFAERMEEETDEFVCITEHFEGRHPRTSDSWPTAVRSIRSFLSDADRRARLRADEHALLLECLGSFAMLAGYELSRSSGARVFPVQKPEMVLWKPSADSCITTSGNAWMVNTTDRDCYSQDIAVIVSVTHHIVDEVTRYLNGDDAPLVCQLVSVSPAGGIGFSSVHGADHAYQLAADLVRIIESVRQNRLARIHLFFSAPNSLLFFIGQYRESLGRMVLYEYDFGLERHCSYRPSISLPLHVLGSE